MYNVTRMNEILMFAAFSVHSCHSGSSNIYAMQNKCGHLGQSTPSIHIQDFML